MHPAKRTTKVTHITDEEPDILPPAIQKVWCEGHFILYFTDPVEKFTKVARCSQLLRELGITLHCTEVKGDGFPRNRRWTYRRVLSEEVLVAVEKAGPPGLPVRDLADTLFRVEPWNDAAQDAALRRASTAASRLVKQGYLSRSYAGDGRTVLHRGPVPFLQRV